MKRQTLNAVLLSGMLSIACGVEETEAGGAAAQAASVCTCQRIFEQGGRLLGRPAPAGCSLPLSSGGVPGPLAPCAGEDVPEVRDPLPGRERPPRHTP